MNKEQFSQVLSDISQERIPDDMDLWNAIQEQIEKPQNVRRIRRSRSGWMMAAIIAIMVTGVVAVLAQGGGENDPLQDPGIQAAAEEGLVTYFNETQTDGNISVTLDYAYADANRLTIAYTTEATLPSDNSLGMYTTTEISEESSLVVTAAVTGGGGGGGGGGEGTEATPAFIVHRTQNVENYDIVTTVDDETLKITYTVHTIFYDPYNQAPYLEEIEPASSFTFEFELPVYRGHQLSEPQTAEVNGVSVTLKNVIVTTSMLRIVFCYDQAEDYSEMDTPWQAFFEVQTSQGALTSESNEQAEYGSGNWTFIVAPEPTDDGCHEVSYSLYKSVIDQVEGEWTITIPYLYLTAPMDVDALIAAFEARGIEVITGELGPDDVIPENTVHIQVFEDGGFSIGQGKEGLGADGQPVDIGAVMAEVSRETAEKIEGPWVFTFSLSE